jgi:hypothetical protein
MPIRDISSPPTFILIFSTFIGSTLQNEKDNRQRVSSDWGLESKFLSKSSQFRKFFKKIIFP